MNAIDQFVNFLTTLYTPKRALATLFMLAGCILALNTFLPSLTLLLEPALHPVTPKYQNYIVVIAVGLGISSGIVVFNLVCWLWNRGTTIYSQRQQQRKINRQANDAALANSVKLVEDFTTAHAHLSAGKLSIIRRLLTVPTESYLTACPDISFMEQAGWILPLTASSNDEKIYKINNIIQPVADKLWNEEVETNSLLFINNEQNICHFIIKAFSDLKSSTEIAGYHFALYERHIKSCFDLQAITSHSYSLRFKQRYKEKFEELLNQKLFSQRLFTVAEVSHPEPVSY